MATLEAGAEPAAVLTIADQNMYLMKSRHATRAAAVPDNEDAALR